MKPALRPGARAISPPRSPRSKQAKQIRKDDAASSLMIERCKQQIENPDG